MTSLRAPNYTADPAIPVEVATGGFTMSVNGTNRYYAIDSAYKNIVIDSSIVFNHIGNGRYQFDVNGGFFPLGNGGSIPHKGLTPADNWIYDGNNGSNQNFSYTMELVWEFIYEQGANQNFSFRGDDDVWVFVKNKLVLDIGGIHEARDDNFNLDQLRTRLNLVDGERTKMHFFYVERHSNEANILITTNIITTKPGSIDVNIRGDELTAGVPEPADAWVIDREGKRITDFTNGSFRWSAREMVQNPSTGAWTPAGNSSRNQPGTANQNTNGTRPNSGDLQVWSQINKNMNKSDSIYLVANKAYTYIELTGCYTENSGEVCHSDIYYVGPGPATRMFVERSGTQPTAGSGYLWAPDTIYQLGTRYIDLTSNQDSTEGFFAILRDAYNNWVGPAVNTRNTWYTANNNIASAKSGTRTAQGEGRAIRVSKAKDTVKVTVEHKVSSAANAQTFTATSMIRLLDVEVMALRIAVMRAGVLTPIPNDSVFMYVDTDTTLYAQVQWSNQPGVWDTNPASANWTAAHRPGSSGALPAASSGSSFQYHPNAPTDIVLTAVAGSSTASVKIKAVYNTPLSMLFFNIKGKPESLSDTVLTNYKGQTKQYRYPVQPATVTVQAGVPLPIVAEMFAINPPTVASYIPKADVVSASSLTWSIVSATNTATTLNAAKTSSTLTFNDSATFRSTVAHQTYVVRATYTFGDVSFPQELRIQVIPGAAAAVYIEPESQDLVPTSLNRPLTFNGSVPTYGADGVITGVKDTLSLAKSETSRDVYALVRDKWGNYIAPSGGYYPYWDNYVEKPTEWGASHPAVVNAVTGGSSSMGQGLVTKDTSAVTTDELPSITATDKTYLDTLTYALPVKILAYSYTELRVREKKEPNEPGHIGDDGTLRITTNDTTVTLIVEGKRSDCDVGDGPTGDDCWEEVTGNWGRDEGLTGSLQTPPPGSSWLLDPRRTGKGNITVSIQGVDNNGAPTPISINVPTVINLGPPTSAQMTVVSATKAGEPIKVEVRYINRTGLMEEWDTSWNSTTDRAKFVDDKTKGGDKAPAPTVKSESGPNPLGYKDITVPDNARLAPDPATGRDTVIFLLYNANENPHNITYTETLTIMVGGKEVSIPLTATVAINLLPGDPTSVVIVDEGGKDVDSVMLDHEKGDVIVLKTVGEDEWGNRTGNVSSNWCVPEGSNIPQSNATCNNNTPTILYDPSTATANDCGILNATSGDLKGDEMKICIKNVSIKPLDAITRDFHGCGYINAVEVTFGQKVELSSEYKSKSVSERRDYLRRKIVLRRDAKVQFVLFDSISVKEVNAATFVVTLYFGETEKSGAPQTDWTLLLNIGETLGDLLTGVKFTDQSVRDGVAPVIYTAKRWFGTTGKLEDDWIEVTLSEKVKSPTKGSFTANANSFRAEELFQIWVEDTSSMSKVRTKKLSKSAKTADAETKRFIPVDSVLNGITKVAFDEKNGVTFRFWLTNKFDIKPPSYYINIQTPPKVASCNISDVLVPANVPLANNRKVAIGYGNEPSEKLIPVPNPASPDRGTVGNSDQAKNPKTGGPAGANEAHKYIGAYDNYGAIPHIKDGGGGAVFQVPIYVPNDATNDAKGGTGSIRCQVKVYDLAGNLVSSGEEKNILSVTGSRVTASNKQAHTSMDLFWSGYNSKGMKSAPGTYRIIVMISYDTKDPDAPKNKKFQGTVGIAK
jgi:fibro-slime domain-containing protein